MKSSSGKPADEVGDRRDHGGEYRSQKKQWGLVAGSWVPVEKRQAVMDDIALHVGRTYLRLKEVLNLYGVSKSTYHGWQSAEVVDKPARRSNIRSPLPEEVEAVLGYRRLHPDVGYRKLTHMMNDASVAFLSESAVFSILQTHGLLSRWDKTGREPADKEYRHKPKVVHEHWHTDMDSKINSLFASS